MASVKNQYPPSDNAPIQGFKAKPVTDKTGTHTSTHRSVVEDAIATVNQGGPYTGQDRDSE